MWLVLLGAPQCTWQRVWRPPVGLLVGNPLCRWALGSRCSSSLLLAVQQPGMTQNLQLQQLPRFRCKPMPAAPRCCRHESIPRRNWRARCVSSHSCCGVHALSARPACQQHNHKSS